MSNQFLSVQTMFMLQAIEVTIVASVEHPPRLMGLKCLEPFGSRWPGRLPGFPQIDNLFGPCCDHTGSVVGGFRVIFDQQQFESSLPSASSQSL